MNGPSIDLPIEVYLQVEGDYVAVMQVEPFGSYFSWHDRDPNRAKAIVQTWYEHTFLPCHHRFEELVEEGSELGDPPAYYQCSRCTVIVARSELQLLQVQ